MIKNREGCTAKRYAWKRSALTVPCLSLTACLRANPWRLNFFASNVSFTLTTMNLLCFPDYGTLRPGDIEASDIEATTLRPGDIEARRHWGQATLRPGDIEARRLWGQICMSNFPKPKHWPQSRDFEANVWPRSRDDVEARRRWGQICMGNYPKERMGCREHIYCTNVQKMQSLSKWKKITSRKW